MKININTQIAKFTSDENGKNLDINMTPQQLLIAKLVALVAVVVLVKCIFGLFKK